MKISPARTAAYDVLIKIETERAFSSVLLPVYEQELLPADRSLCHEIVLGVLRRQIMLDRMVDALVDKRKLDIEVRIILRLGLFQLIFLDRVPTHAAVNDSVELTARAKKASAKGLVNAVLRKASRVLLELSYKDEFDRTSVETSHPRWLLEKWAAEFGMAAATALAAANNQTPKLAFRKTINGNGVEIEERYQKSEVTPGCFIAESFDPYLRELADANKIYFQDEASQMVARAVPVIQREKMLDVCASPGGKTAIVAEFALGRHTLVVAGDRSRRRTELLKKNCIDQGAKSVNVVQYDAARDLPFAPATFDSVLVDAPCSGTGTIRHNPEIRYFIGPDDFQAFQDTQLAILQKASNVVKPGGTLVYSTCSLEREENELVCDAFIRKTDGCEFIKPHVPAAFLTEDGFGRTYPHRDQMDGFFVAALIRK